MTVGNSDARQLPSGLPSGLPSDLPSFPDDERAAGWVVRAQDGDAAAVLAETETLLGQELPARLRAQALYATVLCRLGLDDLPGAVQRCRTLVGHCQAAGLVEAGLRGRALLVDLLRRNGRLEEAIEALARSMALEPQLTDLGQPDVQAALGALAVALRRCGVADEADRLERRLAIVEASLPLPQRVSRWSNLAFEHAGQAMQLARRPPFQIEAGLLREAVVQIDRARDLAARGRDDGHQVVYRVVEIEAQVLHAFAEAVLGDPDAGLSRLRELSEVQALGSEAAAAKLYWIAGTVRALCRLGRPAEAVRLGTAAAARAGRPVDELMLSYELMRAEHPAAEEPGTATAHHLALGEQRVDTDLTLLAALFRARVQLLRTADERQLLARAASMDSLTGLVNRRGAAMAVADAAARAAGDRLALLLIDLDGFKEVNDANGHLAGDVVLREVAAELRHAARSEDVVARWGGDEFVVIAVLDAERAVALADRLRERVRACGARIDAPHLSASVGVAIRDSPVDEETWLRRADEAMYVAKRAGGDATVTG